MKTRNLFTLSALAIAMVSPAILHAQTTVANLRPYDKDGINVFETQKDTTAKFEKVKLNFGAGFTQSFQGLKHESDVNAGANKLYSISSGFNTASANLFMDVQLADGIRLNLTTYLSSRHHNETYVKGGYMQFDKLPFKGQVWDDIMKLVTLKVGHMEINYGDQHFRRTDGGHALYNPFVENYILDAFTTEIGGEVYIQKNGFFGMIAGTNGMIKGSVDSLVATPQDDNRHRSPSIYLKGGFDKQLKENVRLRLAASYYTNSSSGSNTLYGGDRTGSNYFMTMEKAGGSYGANFTSGRLNPGFTKKIDAIQLNAFLKVSGFELFGTFENASGRTKAETETRSVNQFAVDAIYRFTPNEDLFLGVRYNTVKAELAGLADKVTVDRFAVGAGWFLTKNVLLKGEIVNQNYKDFPTTDYRNGGKFNGYVIQAIVGF
jgi:hypothetical protein